MRLFTIGFTQKTAEKFFDLMTVNRVDLLIDVRLNNKSQLAGFAKQPDLGFFLDRIGGIGYIHDPMLAPTDQLLKAYRGKKVSWTEYETEFDRIMDERGIDRYIQDVYGEHSDKTICLLCSEPTADQCHRRLIANRFAAIFHSEIVHL